MKKYLNPILRITTLAILLYIIYQQRQTVVKLHVESKIEIDKCDSVIMICDSLRSELISKDIEIGRYELIIDRVPAELDLDCQLQFEKIVHETE